MNEGKRGFKNKKHVVSAEKVKQRNPVAKNATAGIGGGASGAHDPKKHTRKEKHKKTPADMMEGTSYERKLELQLKMAVVESQLSEASFRDKPGFGSAYAQAARKSTFGNIGAGAMRDPSDPIRAKADRAIANRERGLASQGKYYGAKMAAAKAAEPAAPAPDVDAMKAELEQLMAKFDQLGGDSYQYADKMMPRDIEAREIHHKILRLKGAIQRAEQSVAEGDIERQHGDLKSWSYWNDPKRVAQNLYRIHKGYPIDKSDVQQLWRMDGPDPMTKLLLKPDMAAILSNYEAMSDQGPLFKEASLPKNDKDEFKRQAKLVKDRKTGKLYDPDEQFDKTMNSPEVKAQMKRMAKK